MDGILETKNYKLTNWFLVFPLRRNQHIVTYFGNIHSKLKQHLSEVCHLYQDFAPKFDNFFLSNSMCFFMFFFHTYHVGEACRMLGFPWVDVDGNFTICLEISIPGGSVWIWKKQHKKYCYYYLLLRTTVLSILQEQQLFDTQMNQVPDLLMTMQKLTGSCLRQDMKRKPANLDALQPRATKFDQNLTIWVTWARFLGTCRNHSNSVLQRSRSLLKPSCLWTALGSKHLQTLV